MSRIAILSDIHGNLPALEAVLKDIARQGVDEVLVGGDLVGRGPEGEAVSRRLRATGWRTIRGNHEDYLLDFHHRRVPEEWLERREWSASRWMAAELSAEIVAWLDTLPEQLEAATAPGLLLVHGSPSSANEGLGPWCNDEDLEAHLTRIDQRLLVCAHTHRPMDRVVRGGRVVNIGSVGLPFNGDRRAQYAIFESHGPDDWSVERRRIAYDLRRTLQVYESSGFLAAGGVTARLLRMELENALPFLVPFLEYCSALSREPREEGIADFLDFYDPDESFAELYRRLRALRHSG